MHSQKHQTKQTNLAMNRPAGVETQRFDIFDSFVICDFLCVGLNIRHVVWCHVITWHMHAWIIHTWCHTCMYMRKKKADWSKIQTKNHSPADSVFAPSQPHLCRAPQRHWVALHYPFHRRHSCMAVQSENLRHFLAAARSTTTILYHPIHITNINCISLFYKHLQTEIQK